MKHLKRLLIIAILLISFSTHLFNRLQRKLKKHKRGTPTDVSNKILATCNEVLKKKFPQLFKPKHDGKPVFNVNAIRTESFPSLKVSVCRFELTYKSIPFYTQEVSMIINLKDEYVSHNGKFINPKFNINTIPKVSMEKAIKCAKDNFKAKTMKIEKKQLIILNYTDKNYLAYLVRVEGSTDSKTNSSKFIYDVLINSNDCSTITKVSLLNSVMDINILL